MISWRASNDLVITWQVCDVTNTTTLTETNHSTSALTCLESKQLKINVLYNRVRIQNIWIITCLIRTSSSRRQRLQRTWGGIWILCVEFHYKNCGRGRLLVGSSQNIHKLGELLRLRGRCRLRLLNFVSGTNVSKADAADAFGFRTKKRIILFCFQTASCGLQLTSDRIKIKQNLQM